MLDKSVIYTFLRARVILWVWLGRGQRFSELLAYPNGSKFPLGQRGSDN